MLSRWLGPLLAVMLLLQPAGPGQAQSGSAVAGSAAPARRPNIVVVLLDDVGFGAAATFGGPVATPTLDRLAQQGLRYNRFHTAGICSPTRASLLSGRNPHAVGIGAVENTPDSRPGYVGVLRDDSASIAEVLRQGGYNTAAYGKWHQVADWETSQSGPFDRWPTGVGFEKFYGFLGGETDQYDPTLFEGTTPVMRPAGAHYHLTEDLADRAIAWMRQQQAVTPDKPFFVYFAPGATHAPLQVPAEWIAKYRGRFDQGWDAIRPEILARQKRLGVVPRSADLAARPPGLPAWSTLSADDRRIASRLMETYAGFLEHTDVQVGRLVRALEDMKVFDDTIFIYIVGDNGGSGEGGLGGSLNYAQIVQGLPEDRSAMLPKLDSVGSPETFPQYPAGWAWAMGTPFPWVKTIGSHLGATRNPMVVAWPRGIADKGGLRSQFGHVNDIMPTLLDATGIAMPEAVNGIRQRRLDGSSLVGSFASQSAPEHHPTQYFEVFGHRAIYHEGWMASAFHVRKPWDTGGNFGDRPAEQDSWELYDLRRDFSQAHDIAAANPDKLAELKNRFDQVAAANDVLPVHGPIIGDPKLPQLNRGRTDFTFGAGASVPEKTALPLTNRSWSLEARVEVPAAGAKGVVAAVGGITGGWSLYLSADGSPAFKYRLFDIKTMTLAGAPPLAPGRHVLTVTFDYEGSGYAKGGRIRLLVDGMAAGEGLLPASPPGYFSLSESFDVGWDTGSPAGDYPTDAPPGYPAAGLRIEDVRLRLQ